MIEIPRHFFLREGALYCSPEPTVVTTVLGSCVSVCLWDPRLAISGINHFLLPRWAGDGQASLRYGDVSIGALMTEMEALGCRPSDLVAKVFGGAASFPQSGVGGSNVEYALERLRQHNIEVVAERTGGASGLHLQLFTGSGEVRVRPLSPSQTKVEGVVASRGKK